MNRFLLLTIPFILFAVIGCSNALDEYADQACRTVTVPTASTWQQYGESLRTELVRLQRIDPPAEFKRYHKASIAWSHKALDVTLRQPSGVPVHASILFDDWNVFEATSELFAAADALDHDALQALKDAGCPTIEL